MRNYKFVKSFHRVAIVLVLCLAAVLSYSLTRAAIYIQYGRPHWMNHGTWKYTICQSMSTDGIGDIVVDARIWNTKPSPKHVSFAKIGTNAALGRSFNGKNEIVKSALGIKAGVLMETQSFQHWWRIWSHESDEVDITVNSDAPWSHGASCSGQRFSFQSIMLHEMGHVAGLPDASQPADHSLMRETWNFGEICKKPTQEDLDRYERISW